MNVSIVNCSGLPRYFAWNGVTSTTGTSGSSPIYKEAVYSTFQVIASAAATVVIEGTMEELTATGTKSNWVVLGTITLSGSGTDGAVLPSNWRWVRARPSANSGTVQVIMGV